MLQNPHSQMGPSRSNEGFMSVIGLTTGPILFQKRERRAPL